MTRLLIRDCSVGGVPSSSVLCEDGRIAKVLIGSEVSDSGGTEVIDGRGGTLLPGLTDTHCPPFDYGWLKRSVDLRGVSNVAGLRLRLESGIQKSHPGEWVVGMGWNHEEFPDRRMPDKGDIDDISPSNPVALQRICGHMSLLNTRAIEALGFESRRGEELERDQTGALTGIAKEKASTEAFASIPKSPERLASDLLGVEAEAARLGLTTVHCIVSPEGYREELAALVQLADAGSLSLRYRIYIPPEALEFAEAEGLFRRLRGDMLRINGVKIFTDGSLGARTAALNEPYSDDPTNSGILRMSDEELSGVVELADSKGLQAIVHAIGDRAAEQAIEALARVTGSQNPRRHRIEHAGLLPRALRGKMLKHGIRAAVQPLFVTSDTWAVDRLGNERILDFYPTKSMLKEGIVASGGSDCPVESWSPVLGMWAAMTRGGIVPEECVDLGEAITLYTTNAASNGFDEARLAEGAPGDLTLLDSDITGMHPALLRKVGVLATVVDGKAVHSFGAG